MLICDFRIIGNKLYSVRKHAGLTQAEVAEAAGLSDRTYADIERGVVNMRIETMLKICNALNITPDDILTKDDSEVCDGLEEFLKRFEECSVHEKKTALKLLSVYLDSLNK